MNVDMLSSTPAQVATSLLAQKNGDIRSAEAVAWRGWEHSAGGQPFNRPNADTAEALFMQAVIREILHAPGGKFFEAAA